MIKLQLKQQYLQLKLTISITYLCISDDQILLFHVYNKVLKRANKFNVVFDENDTQDDLLNQDESSKDEKDFAQIEEENIVSFCSINRMIIQI